MRLVIYCMIFLALFICKVYAIGPYDGIWIAKLNEQPVRYFTIHEHNDNSVVVILLDMKEKWEAYFGVRSGNMLLVNVLNLFDDYMSITIQINFTSTNSFQAELIVNRFMNVTSFQELDLRQRKYGDSSIHNGLKRSKGDIS